MAPQPKPTPIDTQADRARHRAQRGLWRQAAWGGAAAFALIAAAFATQTQTGAQRLQLAFAGSNNPDSTARLVAAERRAEEAQAQVRQLASELRKLSADRTRLDARLAGIERDFNDLTGAIGRQPPQAWQTGMPGPSAAALAPLTLIMPLSLPGGLAALAPWSHQTPAAEAAATAAPTSDLSEPHPVTTIAVTRPQKAQAPPQTKTAAAPTATEKPPAPQAAPEKVATIAPIPEPNQPPKLGAPPQTIIVAPLPAATAEPQPKASGMVQVPPPPLRVAALPESRTTAPRKPEYGIDIGGAPSTARLNALWREVKARYGPQVVGLRPLIAHDRRARHLPYRLVIGPLPNAAVAADLCAHFGLARGHCRATRFVGEPLAQR